MPVTELPETVMDRIHDDLDSIPEVRNYRLTPKEQGRVYLHARLDMDEDTVCDAVSNVVEAVVDYTRLSLINFTAGKYTNEGDYYGKVDDDELVVRFIIDD